MIYLYTDGSALGNPGPGGLGIVLVSGIHRKELSRAFRFTTNNRMELLAVILGLEALKQPNHEVTVVSDSKYVIDAVTKNWLRSWEAKAFIGKKNVDLWQRFLRLSKNHKMHYEWIKGHNGHPENEKCDQLATHAAHNGPFLIDQGYEQLKARPNLF